jgi:site-specific DNA-methyltransferase (adenine-specific)
MLAIPQLHCGDCFDVLNQIPAGSIDLVMTDPPFGVTDNHWDTAPPLDEFWVAMNRVASDEAVFAVCCQQPFTTELILSNRRNWRYELIWHKPRPTGFLSCRLRPLRAHEQIQIFCRRPAQSTYKPQMTPGKPYRIKRGLKGQSSNWGSYGAVDKISAGPRHPRSVLHFGCAPNNGDHPTQKPVEMGRWLTLSYSNAGDRVLDCFMGSGTFGVAAVEAGRAFIGIERDEKHFATAQRRINRAVDDRSQ